jgi:DNA-binding PadR family transcriptional regulator
MKRSSERITQDSQPGVSTAESCKESGIDAEEAFAGDADNVTVAQLYNELQSERAESTEKDVRLTPEQQSEVILEQVLSALFHESGFRFEESLVKENLDEILLLLVAHRSSDTHGKSLMGDLATIFNTRLSPGTVYPQLHDLENDGLLTVQELVRTKEYQIEKKEELAEQVTSAMEQHLALGLFYQAALAELS